MTELDGVSLPSGKPKRQTSVSQSPASTRGLAWLLGALAAFGPFAVDAYLPAFPRIAKDLGTSIGTVQITLAVFLLGLGVGQVFWGTLSDHVGRRIPLLSGCLLFSGTALVCAMTHNIHILIVARLLMGIGGSAGVVVPRAIVRDLFEEAEAAKFYTLMMFVSGVAPIAAPLLGSILLTYFNWRTIFWALAVMGGICTVACLRSCPETLAREDRMRGHVSDVFRGYGRVLVNRRFLGPAMALGCVLGMLFTYIASSAYLFIELFGIPVALFGILFAANSFGLYIGTQSNHWLLRRFSSGKLLRSAMWMNVGCALLLVCCTWTKIGGFPLFFAILFLCISTLGSILPNATAIAMQPFPDEAGSASAVLGIFQFVLGAIGGAVVGIFQNGSALPVAIQILCFGLVAQGMLLLNRTAHRSR